MLQMAGILADHDPMYEDIAFKFLENSVSISYAMDKVGERRDNMWDEKDGSCHGVLRLPDGAARAVAPQVHLGELGANEQDLRR